MHDLEEFFVHVVHHVDERLLLYPQNVLNMRLPQQQSLRRQRRRVLFPEERTITNRTITYTAACQVLLRQEYPFFYIPRLS